MTEFLFGAYPVGHNMDTTQAYDSPLLLLLLLLFLFPHPPPPPPPPPSSKNYSFLTAWLCFSLVADIFISLRTVTQCPLFLLMSSCIVCLLPLILKTHRWQSTLSGVNSKFRSSWYGYASTLNVSPPYLWSILSLLYLVPSLSLPQMSVGTHCACRLLRVYTERGSSESIACRFFVCVCVLSVPIPLSC